ncbi:endo-1,4-beta-xylanase [Glaciecola sp. 1036]|uniref:endo-1,4-beta-xylanase n=1 Tax=Alteromonadaceae TaxID=72275 RepID=UPI003D00CBFC
MRLATHQLQKILAYTALTASLVLLAGCDNRNGTQPIPEVTVPPPPEPPPPPPPPSPPPPPEEGPMAEGQDKFLGSVCCGNQAVNFSDYFNQVTPENAGKWGSTEATRDAFAWDNLDEAYELAKDNGYPFKMHVLVWGNQQPNWIRDLPTAEQLVEIQEWFDAVNERYPELDYIEVVNEFDNDPPNAENDGPNYIDALRLFAPETTTELVDAYLADGLTQSDAEAKAAEFDWIINAFQMARNTFPATANLMINEYNVINSPSRTAKLAELAMLLKDRELIDSIAFQAHAFSLSGTSAQMQTNLETLAATALDIYIAELDIDGPTELTQLQEYQRIFPIFWEHPSVKGITLWGYRPGLWRDEQGAALVREDDSEKPALVWLNSYVRGLEPEIVAPGAITILAQDTSEGTEVVTLTATGPNGADIDAEASVEWSLLGGDGSQAFAIDAATGTVTVAGTLESGENHLLVQVKVDDHVSRLLDLVVPVDGEPDPIIITYDFVNDAQGFRADYGTTATTAHNAAEQALEVTPDWSANTQNIIGQIALTDYTGASIEYSITVTQAQIDGGLSAQGYVQTGAPNYTRIYGPQEALIAGTNTFTFAPVDDGNGSLALIERVSIQFNGPLTSGTDDKILINQVVVTLPGS